MSTFQSSKSKVSCRHQSHRAGASGASWGPIPLWRIRSSPAETTSVCDMRLELWRTLKSKWSGLWKASDRPVGGQDGGWVTDCRSFLDIRWWRRGFHWLETTWGGGEHLFKCHHTVKLNQKLGNLLAFVYIKNSWKQAGLKPLNWHVLGAWGNKIQVKIS